MTITQTATIETDSPESFGLIAENQAPPRGAYLFRFHELPPELQIVIAQELRTALSRW